MSRWISENTPILMILGGMLAAACFSLLLDRHNSRMRRLGKDWAATALNGCVILAFAAGLAVWGLLTLHGGFLVIPLVVAPLVAVKGVLVLLEAANQHRTWRRSVTYKPRRRRWWGGIR